ncbi:MAG: hypothetical protein VXY45_11890 [Pseudomonadota bacterium]|nr:hypothetical protein [Pseudomonadota bacterium]
MTVLMLPGTQFSIHAIEAKIATDYRFLENKFYPAPVAFGHPQQNQ